MVKERETQNDDGRIRRNVGDVEWGDSKEEKQR